VWFISPLLHPALACDHPVRDIVASRPSFTGGEVLQIPLLSRGGVARSAGVVWFI
jgi:hypothetical protein